MRSQRRDSSRTLSVESQATSSCTAIPDEPWLEKSWDRTSIAYQQLRRLYSGYFDHVHRVEGEEKALVDLVMCQLNCFVRVDVLLDRKLLLLLVNSFAQITERYLHRQEFVQLMFLLSFASKERLEEAAFDIVSGGQSRVTVAQLVQMHVHRMQRRMSVQVINLISECDRSGCGMLDVYDFRLLIGKLQEMEQSQCTQLQPPLDEERARLEEALLEAQELQSWSWNIGDVRKRCSPQLRDLAESRAQLEKFPGLAEALSKLAWDYPEILSMKFVEQALSQCYEMSASTGGSTVSGSDDDIIDKNEDQATTDT